MGTSEELELGALYTRAELRERFEIADQTINTGIFQPAGHDSVWLFVTERKEAGMTDYTDRLDGDVLYWQGQTAGRKDDLVVEHKERGLELLLFYRPSKNAYPGYGFRFEGPFEYVSHEGSQPTSFVLRRAGRTTPPASDERHETTGEPVPGRAPGDASTCLVDVLAQLRQSGRDAVIAEGNVTALQERMHVPDAIEEWVAERIAAWREAGRLVPLLIVLSGNAGDGKSDLVERLRKRKEVAGGDLEVIADATHSDSPSQSQAERLAVAFSRFPTEREPGGAGNPCVLVAMNVGMVIAFFAALKGTPDETRFGALQGVLEASLGLSGVASAPPDHWQCEVVNLDHRNVLGLQSDGLFHGMLRKLDPEEPGSLTHEAAAACLECPARGSCWVRTNLSLLRRPEVHQSLHELLWEATLGSDVHLSPRNLWDLLYQVTTGGLEMPGGEGPDQFLSCEWIQDHLPASAQQFNASQLSLVHRRLLYNLLFEPSDPDGPSRGPLLDALASADPIRMGGKHTHLAEGEVRAAPKADSEALSTLALMATEPVPGSAGQQRPDPLLDSLASLATDPLIWQELGHKNAGELALGVSRRARVTGLPSEIQAEVSDQDARAFLELLHAYAAWRPGSKAPDAVNEFWLEKLVGGVGQIFGVEVQGKTYFRLDTLSPATRFPAYVPVDLKDKLSITPDAVTSSGAQWLSSVAYLPRRMTATIDAGGDQPWAVPVDLQLYRLLSHVSRGYAASSVDLEAFFRLRYACERLGSTDESGEIVFRALVTGEVLRLQRQRQLSGWETQFTRVGAP